jgi:hypothetical protein
MAQTSAGRGRGRDLRLRRARALRRQRRLVVRIPAGAAGRGRNPSGCEPRGAGGIPQVASPGARRPSGAGLRPAKMAPRGARPKGGGAGPGAPPLGAGGAERGRRCRARVAHLRARLVQRRAAGGRLRPKVAGRAGEAAPQGGGGGAGEAAVARAPWSHLARARRRGCRWRWWVLSCEAARHTRACPISTGRGTRRVRLVRGEGRGVSD